VFTALLAWFVFKENVDRRIAAGMLAIIAGALIIGWRSEARVAGIWPSLAVLAACFAWAIDNNLTRKVSLSDPTWIASVKGLAAGSVNLILALLQGASLPNRATLGIAMIVGFISYGVSLGLFVVALRHLGTARTSAYFSVAPFFGAVVAVACGEPVTVALLAAAALMGLGVWIHLAEQHAHQHTHETLEHEHEHLHDDHHQHDHEYPVRPGAKHTHPHQHTSMTHRHAHYPDAHHRHEH
jgi:drug/metabolite transporter (DMT)-like permease